MASFISALFGMDRKKRKRIAGDIGYFHLEDWWMATFSDQERSYIVERYNPMGSEGRSLVEGEITFSSATPGMFLVGLATWFQSPEDRSIAKRILEKSIESSKDLKSNSDVLDRRFALSTSIPTFYRDREDPQMLRRAVDSCLAQIELAPRASSAFFDAYPDSPLPTHVGYDQLAVIYEKQEKLAEAITLCNQAKKQGWNGDWDKRIARCEKKLGKIKG